MHKTSVEEYKLLKKELSEIKECINRYIGYIIGSNGLVFILVSVIGSNLLQQKRMDSSLTALILLLTGWIVLVTLYSIIAYKLNSHNRHVGYMHVMVQENEFQEMNFTSKYNPIKWLFKKEDMVSQNTQNQSDTNLILWEYVMTRWNSKQTPKEYPEFAYDKLDLRFETGKYRIDNVMIDIIDSSKKDNVYQAFNKYIAWEHCQRTTWKRMFKSRFTKSKMYKKYKLSSWGYPARLGTLISALYIILGVSVGLAWYFYAHVNNSISTVNSLGLVSIFYLPYFAILIRGIHTHLRLQYGDMTTDYYCWAFLIFRVQYLNHKGIRPVYFSTAFIRYIKSLQLSEYIKKISIEEFKSEINGHTKGKRTKRTAQELKFYLVNSIEKGLEIDKKYKPYLKYVRNQVLSIDKLNKQL